MKFRVQQVRRRNGMLSELAELVSDKLKQHGIDEVRATEEAEEIAFSIHRRWAGMTFTFPVKDELAMKRLALHIIKEYDGSNAPELIRRYRVTEDWIYSVIREFERQRAAENQHTIDFGS